MKKNRMEKGKTKDITVEILISIRDEIKRLREDTNARFAEIDKRFERIEKDINEMRQDINIMKQDISEMRQDIKAIVARFDRDYIVLANETEDIKRRLVVCERKLNITSN